MSAFIKRIITSIAIVWMSGGALFAQPPERFIKKYYPEPNLNALCTGVATTGYGYMLAGLVEEAGGYYTYCLTGLDQNGDELWQKRYGNANRSFLPHYDPDAVGMGRLSKGNRFYFAVVLTHEATDSLFSTLFKFDEQGDTLWTKTLRGDDEHAFLYANCVRLLPNGNFGVVGTVENNNWIPDGEVAKSLSFLAILDDAGNQIWRKKYDYTPGTCKEGTARIIILSMAYDSISNRYFLVGKETIPAYPLMPYGSYRFILDDEGDVILQGYGYPTSFCDVKMLSDGNFVAGGSSNFWDPSEQKFFHRANLTIFNIAGRTLSNWDFYPTCSNYYVHSRFHQIEVMEGDTIVAVGMADTKLDQNGIGQNNMFFLYKLGPELWKPKWKRLIDIDPQFHDYGVAMALTDDGGFALAGTCHTDENSPMVLVKTDARGCVEEGCTEGDWLVDFEADQTTIRVGEEVSFANLSVGADTFHWFFERGTPETAYFANINTTPTITYNYPGTYSVTLAATGALSIDTMYKRNYITVLPLDPIADFTADETIVQAGASVHFTNRSKNADSYSWYFEGGDPETSALKDPVVTYRTAGNFDVRLIVTNDVGEEEELKENYITVNPVGIDEQESASASFTIFPNPAQEQITFEYPYAEGATVTVEIYNLAGQLIDCVTMTGNRQAYSAEHLTNNIYFATLKVDGKIVSTQKMALIK